MDVMRLDRSTWDAKDDSPVEGYTSLIWTERFQDFGEFEMRTRKISETRALIPEGSFIGLRDAQEVMIVETYSIEEADNGPEAVITGRSFESFFEQRATVAVNPTPGASAMWTYGGDDLWPTDTAKALIESHVTISPEAPFQQVPGTAVENLVGTGGTIGHTGEQLSYDHERGNLYDEVLNMLQLEDAGIRNQLNWTGQLKIYIYKGKNRTAGQSTNAPVIFRLDMEDLVDPKYLFSVKDYRNVAYVVGDNWQQRVYAPGVDTGVSGLNRKILLVDGSEIKASSTTAKKTKQANALGLAALAKQNKTIFFDGEVSPDSPYRRGVDYNLGDLVTLMGQYGVSQTMLVNEFVRTEDNQGERAFPTLVQLGEE